MLWTAFLLTAHAHVVCSKPCHLYGTSSACVWHASRHGIMHHVPHVCFKQGLQKPHLSSALGLCIPCFFQRVHPLKKIYTYIRVLGIFVIFFMVLFAPFLQNHERLEVA